MTAVDFREDLFYRFQVFDIRIPPLRERRADILPLSEAFLQEIGKSFGRPPAGLTKDAREALLGHDWPGNVRELRNALERAAILAEGGLIHSQHLALQSRTTPTSGRATSDLGTVEREMIARVLRETRWNKSKAAKRLGLSRTQLYVRLRKYGLDETAAASELIPPRPREPRSGLGQEQRLDRHATRRWASMWRTFRRHACDVSTVWISRSISRR